MVLGQFVRVVLGTAWYLLRVFLHIVREGLPFGILSELPVARLPRQHLAVGVRCRQCFPMLLRLLQKVRELVFGKGPLWLSIGKAVGRKFVTFDSKLSLLR